MSDLRNLKIEIYEVLSGPRQDTFIKIREEARRLGVFKVWHRNGVFYACKVNNSSIVRVYEVDDIGRLLGDCLDFFIPALFDEDMRHFNTLGNFLMQ